MQAHDFADAEVAEEQGNGTAVPGSPLSKDVGNDASVDAINCTRSSDEGGEESVEPLQDATEETPAELATEAAAGATGQSADELPQECDAGMVLEAEGEHAPFESTVGLNGEATTVSTTRSLRVYSMMRCVCVRCLCQVYSMHPFIRTCMHACMHAHIRAHTHAYIAGTHRGGCNSMGGGGLARRHVSLTRGVSNKSPRPLQPSASAR